MLSLVAFAVSLAAILVVVVGAAYAGGMDAPVRLLATAGAGAVAVAALQWRQGDRMVSLESPPLRERTTVTLAAASDGYQPLQQSVLTALHTMMPPRTRAKQRRDPMSASESDGSRDRRPVSPLDHEHLHAVLEMVPDGVLITGASNEVLAANASAGRTLGFDPAAALHERLDRLTTEPALLARIDETHRRRAPRGPWSEHAVRVAGRTRYYQVNSACVLNPRREPAGVVTVLHDMTREKELAELKSDFVCGISHELRTPLSSIKAYVEMLIDGEADEERTRGEFCSIIYAEANRLSRLIDNMLSISRIKSGMMRGQWEDVAIGPLLADVTDLMLPQARARRIRLRTEPAAASVRADRDLLYQAMINLVGNAIKYTPAGGDVRVETHADRRRRLVHISVSDTGLGVPAESLPYLFEKFYRVPDHKRMAEGTGLGLNLVKHVIETVHHGRVRVTSEVGRGSTFTVTLPQSELTTPAEPHARPAPQHEEARL